MSLADGEILSIILDTLKVDGMTASLNVNSKIPSSMFNTNDVTMGPLVSLMYVDTIRGSALSIMFVAMSETPPKDISRKVVLLSMAKS